LGNYPASGTEIIKELGEEHVRTGKPIVYTSADSVFQVAAHEEIIPIEEQYSMCRIAREMLCGEHAIGRVIARPFVGNPGNFKRTEQRKDFSLEPPTDTILDVLKAAGYQVVGVGKIEDIFTHRGLTMRQHTGNNMTGVDAVLEFLEMDFSGLIFANLVDFDALYGHRNDPVGYAKALIKFDDHGNDPTDVSTDHTRERVPLLVYGELVRKNYNMGIRDSFADVAASIANCLGELWQGPGHSFGDEILKNPYT
jgi:phosphopentomutase